MQRNSFIKLALGTVQFGLDYGVANQAGRVRLDDVGSILKFATEHSIDTLDTAIAYGDSEYALGLAGVSGCKIVTKLSEVPFDCSDVAGWVELQIDGSLRRLGVNQLHGVLLHRPAQLLGQSGEQLIKALVGLRTLGLTKKIGVSIYAPEELDHLVEVMDFDLVQAPLNILDRRLIDSGWAERLSANGVELHTRSAFLQGLLLMSPDQRPTKFSKWHSVWTEWARWLGDTGLTPLQACLAYVLGVEDTEKVVVGVDSVVQLREILDASQSTLPSLPDWKEPIDPVLINPSKWYQL